MLFRSYLCCQVRRWAALAVALFFPQHPLVQPVAELLFTLPLLLLFIRFLAPSMRQLSRYPASVQCQFGIVPLVSYLFDYITHVYTSLLSEANPAAVEFMFFVCCAAFLCSILRASRVERQRIQMEQLQTSLNLQVTQAMREIEALRLSQQRASTYRHDLRHHMQFLAGCIENGRTEQALGYIRSVCSEIEAGKVTAYCENEAANLIFSAFADRAAKAGVQFTVQAGISQALPVSESDLCVLLSNALENALHAAVRCREAGQGAFIETTGHEKGKKLFLQITLEEELDGLEDYIYLQQMRFDGRITVEKSIRVQPAAVLVPSFMLQPVVENAYSHGLKSREEGGRILLRAWMQDKVLVLTVADNGKGMTAEELDAVQTKITQSEQTGRNIGLGNISRRIGMLYPGGKMQIYSRTGHGTVVRFELPQTQQPEEKEETLS